MLTVTQRRAINKIGTVNPLWYLQPCKHNVHLIVTELFDDGAIVEHNFGGGESCYDMSWLESTAYDFVYGYGCIDRLI